MWSILSAGRLDDCIACIVVVRYFVVYGRGVFCVPWAGKSLFYLGNMTRLVCLLFSCGLVRVGDFFGDNRYGLGTFGNVYTGCMVLVGSIEIRGTVGF